jgi:hypothetical protein
MTTLNVQEPVRAGANAAVEVSVKESESRDSTALACVTSVSLEPKQRRVRRCGGNATDRRSP